MGHTPELLHNLRSIEVDRAIAAVAGKRGVDCIQALDRALGVVRGFGDLVHAPTFVSPNPGTSAAGSYSLINFFLILSYEHQSKQKRLLPTETREK